MKAEIIELDSLEYSEVERKIAERYDLGNIINSSSFNHKLELGAHDRGSISTENGSLSFSYVLKETSNSKYILKIYPRE